MEQRRGLESLTKREKDCLRLLLGARSVKLIAQELRLSPSTVEGYLKSARGKLGVSDSGEAARSLAAYEGVLATPRVSGDGSAQLVSPLHEVLADPALFHIDRQQRGEGGRLGNLLQILFPPIERPLNELGTTTRLNIILAQAGLTVGTSLLVILLVYALGSTILSLVQAHT